MGRICAREINMEYYVAVFKSRTDAFTFSNTLKRNGIPSAIIPTPQEAGRTCGLSVKILPVDIDFAKLLLSRIRVASFTGWFLFSIRNGEKIVVRG